MRETRKCVICPLGKFRCKTTSTRKTCSRECSIIYTIGYRKKLQSKLSQKRKEVSKPQELLIKVKLG